MNEKMNELKLAAGKLYILSGLQASGKSTILKNSIEFGNVTPEMVLSTDSIRESVVGKLLTFSGNRVKDRVYEGNHAIFEVLETILKEKLREKLTIFVDATSISDIERGVFVRLAESFGVESEILIMNEDLDSCLERNKDREVVVRESTISEFSTRFELESEYPYRHITCNDYFTLEANSLPFEHDRIDVIGDVHGLYDKFIQLIEEAGYRVNDKTNVIEYIRPGLERKILLLGDIVDRGYDSLKMLKLVKNSVEAGTVYMVAGNHEAKLLLNLTRPIEKVTGSFAVLETFLEFYQRVKNFEPYVNFLRKLPGYVVHKDFVFAHANIGHFDFRKTPFSELIYGAYKDRVDSDKEYQELYDFGHNDKTLIRGHMLKTSDQHNVFSLETDCCDGGYISMLPLDRFIDLQDSVGNQEAFADSIVQVRTGFFFSRKLRESMLTQMRQLIKQKFAISKTDSSGMLKLYKYSKKVFYKDLWERGGEPLLKARGIVLDLSGRIVQHPFDKIFNYKERGTGEEILDSEVVQYIQKLNGFLGNIGFDPINKKLLYTTTGSFEGEFVDYIKEYITPEKELELIRFLTQQHKGTLSFEVIHPEDPHIVDYPDHMYGLHLIGFRGLQKTDKSWYEDDVDNIAKQLNFRRATWDFATFGEVKEKLKGYLDEGFMIRRKKPKVHGYDFYMKMKSPYYLTSKFISRMSKGNVKFLFNNPEAFKEKMEDEEFYPLVDIITTEKTFEEFSTMDSTSKVDYVRAIVLKLL